MNLSVAEDGCSRAVAVGVRMVETESDTQVNEDGQMDHYHLTLYSQPIHTVVISITGDDNLEIVGQSTLTFAPATWNQVQTVTVKARDDALVEETHVGRITHQVISDDLAYQNWLACPVTALIDDNDIHKIYLPRFFQASSQHTDRTDREWRNSRRLLR